MYGAIFYAWVERGRPEKIGVDIIIDGLEVMSATASGFAFLHGDAYNIDAEAICSRSRATRASTSTRNSPMRRSSPFDLRTPKEPAPPFIS